MNKYFLFLILLFFQSSLFAQRLEGHISSNIDPLRAIQKVHPKSKVETVYRLKNPRIAIADYALIKKDFPQIANLADSEIDKWLLDQVGYISQGQKAQTSVNTFIETVDDYTRQGWRPPEYGRALIYDANFEGKSIGVLDVKGAGALKPSQASHGNGVMTLGESLREYNYEKMMTSVIDHSGIENKVVGSYAVIDPGFRVLHADGSTSPAGFYIRQAHRRVTAAEANSVLSKYYHGEPRGNGWMLKKWRNRYNDLLNKYGVWANGNYQGTVNNELFDFGHYIIREDLNTSEKNLLIPFEQWGFDAAKDEEIATSSDRWKFSKKDRPWRWAHETAEAFAEGKATRHDVWMHHYQMVKPVQQKLRLTQRLYDFAEKLGFKIKGCQKVFDLQGR